MLDRFLIVPIATSDENFDDMEDKNEDYDDEDNEGDEEKENKLDAMQQTQQTQQLSTDLLITGGDMSLSIPLVIVASDSGRVNTTSPLPQSMETPTTQSVALGTSASVRKQNKNPKQPEL